jgi:hypothetical protein
MASQNGQASIVFETIVSPLRQIICQMSVVKKPGGARGSSAPRRARRCAKVRHMHIRNSLKDFSVYAKNAAER